MPVKRTNPDYQAQAILSRRDHSIFEVKTKMKRKGFTASQINNAIARLKKLKLLDDRAFANKYINETLHFKTVGPRWVMHKLRQKGIDEEIIDQAIASTFTDNRELELAKQAATQWQRLHPSTSSTSSEQASSEQASSGQASKYRQRLTRFLISRGFSPSQIDNIIN